MILKPSSVLQQSAFCVRKTVKQREAEERLRVCDVTANTSKTLHL